ncbi:MAG: hypothetical protein C6W55_12475 [Thermobacillus sp.]|uniref:hypothetical protein n=1 Tax=Thermobacillus sp. TaxID=2108467 RepID=UPI000E3A0C2B|nr:hypothetical protein [Thermobacillus sp.]REK54049.1 MAG: hypothetical protein C6W55_12475 [Thermobacillus sp.]
MTVLKGDRVRLQTGETGIVVEVWGIARTWLKVDTGSGHVICMAAAVERIINRDKGRKWR